MQKLRKETKEVAPSWGRLTLFASQPASLSPLGQSSSGWLLLGRKVSATHGWQDGLCADLNLDQENRKVREQK